MKKRTKIFIIVCIILAVILLAAESYFKTTFLSAIACGLISGCIVGVMDKYCN